MTPTNLAHPLLNSVGVITDIEGTELTAEDRVFLSQPEISGLIFFARNYESPKQLKALTQQLRALRPDLLLTVDQEGGRVQRFRSGFSRFAPMMSYEALYQTQPAEALVLAKLGGWLLASELIACGVDLTFAPVLDIECDCSLVIGDRAFGHSGEAVTELARALINGLQQAGMQAVGKHFPGHGGVVADSHLELPVDPRSEADLKTDLLPFATLIGEGKLGGIMPAHVVFTAVDSEHTAGFSQRWLQEILRQELGFNGIIFSDDLSMEGAASGGDFYQRSLAAAQAGANALVVCNNRQAAIEVVRAAKYLHANGTSRLPLQHWQPRRDSRQSEAGASNLLAARERLTAAGLLV
ncbi:MAG: beta-N-acetylhexosaminidase [Oleibacter sp.]|nr:beta-N-acetylhexosaminidase [Thalassolituus sp.]